MFVMSQLAYIKKKRIPWTTLSQYREMKESLKNLRENKNT